MTQNSHRISLLFSSFIKFINAILTLLECEQFKDSDDNSLTHSLTLTWEYVNFFASEHHAIIKMYHLIVSLLSLYYGNKRFLNWLKGRKLNKIIFSLYFPWSVPFLCVGVLLSFTFSHEYNKNKTMLYYSITMFKYRS